MMAIPTVMVQPDMFHSPNGPKTGKWSSGICDCCEDMGICCFGFWCPCCLMCTTSENFGESLCLPLVEIFFGGGLIPPLTYAMRSSMRERYRIQLMWGYPVQYCLRNPRSQALGCVFFGLAIYARRLLRIPGPIMKPKIFTAPH